MTATVERPRLRELRMQQGWTQQEVADRMARLAWARGETIGVTADMVAKWERGAKGVSARYRALLARVFHVSVNELGLPPLARGHSGTRPDSGSLVAMVDQAAGLLDRLGDAGHAVRPQILAALADDVLSRRTMLAVIDAPAPAKSPPTPAELDTLADEYEAARATTEPAALMTAVAAHLRLIGDALASRQSAGIRQQLLRNRARVALLAGQLAVEDLANPMAGRAYYSQATDDAYETADQRLIILAHNCSARLAASQDQIVAMGRYRAAVEVLTDRPVDKI